MMHHSMMDGMGSYGCGGMLLPALFLVGVGGAIGYAIRYFQFKATPPSHTEVREKA